jgi:hypothetical protein
LGNALSTEEGVADLQRQVTVLQLELDAAYSQVAQLKTDNGILRYEAKMAAPKLNAFDRIRRCLAGISEYYGLRESLKLGAIALVVEQAAEKVSAIPLRQETGIA